MEVNVQPHVPAAFSSGRKTPLPTELEGGSAPWSGLDLFGEEKTLASARIQTSDRLTGSLVTILSWTSLPNEVPRYDGTGLGFYTFSWQWQGLLSWPSFRGWFWGSFLRAVQNCVCLSDPCPMRRPTTYSEQFIGRGSETLVIFDEEFKLWCSQPLSC